MKNASNLLSIKNLIKIIGVVLILVLVAQLSLTFLPFIELEYKTKGEMVSEEFSLFDQLWWKTERMTSAQGNALKTKQEALDDRRQALEELRKEGQYDTAEFKQEAEALRKDIADLMVECEIEATLVSAVKDNDIKQDLKNMKADLKVIKDYLKVYSINDLIVPLALSFALSLLIILTTLLSWRCLATHVVAVVYVFVSIPAYFTSGYFARANLPPAESVILWSRVLIVVASVFAAIRTGLWIYERYVKAYIKFMKAKDAWKIQLAEAIAAEEAAKAEAAAE